jgi:hypothetical protein
LGFVLGVDVGALGDQVLGGGEVVGPGGVPQSLVEVRLAGRVSGPRSCSRWMGMSLCSAG